MRWRSACGTALLVVALLWAGMVLGVAFVAVPAQFAAEGLSRPLGIDVTRHVFASFGRIEIGLAAATLVLAFLLRPRRLLWVPLALLCLMVALQSLWLLPVLDVRADLLLQGQEPPPGPWHGLFVVSEFVKLGMLLCVAWAACTLAAMPKRAVPPLLAVIAALVAGCAAQSPWQGEIKRYYTAHASEKNGRCLAPYIDGFTTIQVVEETPERTVIDARYLFRDWIKDGGDQPFNECVAYGARRFVLTRDEDAGMQVTEMSGPRRN